MNISHFTGYGSLHALNYLRAPQVFCGARRFPPGNRSPPQAVPLPRAALPSRFYKHTLLLPTAQERPDQSLSKAKHLIPLSRVWLTLPPPAWPARVSPRWDPGCKHIHPSNAQPAASRALARTAGKAVRGGNKKGSSRAFSSDGQVRSPEKHASGLPLTILTF